MEIDAQRSDQGIKVAPGLGDSRPRDRSAREGGVSDRGSSRREYLRDLQRWVSHDRDIFQREEDKDKDKHKQKETRETREILERMREAGTGRVHVRGCGCGWDVQEQSVSQSVHTTTTSPNNTIDESRGIGAAENITAPLPPGAPSHLSGPSDRRTGREDAAESDSTDRNWRHEGPCRCSPELACQAW